MYLNLLTVRPQKREFWMFLLSLFLLLLNSQILWDQKKKKKSRYIFLNYFLILNELISTVIRKDSFKIFLIIIDSVLLLTATLSTSLSSLWTKFNVQVLHSTFKIVLHRTFPSSFESFDVNSFDDRESSFFISVRKMYERKGKMSSFRKFIFQ